MASSNMTRRFSISLTRQEYAVVARRAKRHHISMSAYGRQRVLGKPDDNK